MDSTGFSDAWDDFFAAVRRARGRAAQNAQPGELSLAQYQLLAAFANEDEMSVGDVAIAGGVATPTATRMLSGLERDGIVERRASEVDRRCVQVRLTAEGRRMLEAKRRVVLEKQRVIFAALNPDEQRQAEPILRRLAVAMEDL